MRKTSKKEKEPLIVVYGRLEGADYMELQRREATTGAPIARQIRILIHEALRKKVMR